MDCCGSVYWFRCYQVHERANLNNYWSRAASGGPGIVACLVGPGPEEVILLLDFDFLMSSFGGGLFALCTSLNNGDGLKVETQAPLSQRRRVFGTDTIVRHYKSLVRPYASHWTLATPDCRNFASRWYMTSCFWGPLQTLKDTQSLY